ncbi:MAG: LamG domain-containing protein, partial [Candidatus Azambacteria bacterium]|nr:LamG domain-containing protein [Candidatus Azambacteria bacterium]
SQSGLVGNWTFIGPDTTWTSATAGTTADKSGNNHTGTMTNMSRDTSPAPGISGQALSFDGSNDYVEIPYSANLNNITTGITFSAWLKPSSGSLSSRRDIIQRWYDGNVWWFKLDNLGKLSFYAPNITGGVYKESTNAISEGVWTYGVITYDDATDIRFYINGQLDNTITASGSFLTSTSGIWIGINGYDLSTPFNGLIDELRIYNRALSASEVQDLYRIGAARLKVNTPITQRGSQSGLVGNWTFNGPDMGSISQLGSELVTNGNFGSNITGWQNDGSASTIAWQNAASGDGSTGYLRFTIASNADYDRFDSTSSVASANTTYRVSYWYRTSGITGNLNTFFTDDFFNLTNTVWANELTPSTSWQFVSFDLTTNSLSYPYFGIAKAGSIGSGTFDVDAISVKEITTTTIALDRSGSGNNGTTTNMSTASLAPGISGQALKFDGVDDRVDTTNFMSSGVTAFTLQAWVYKTATKDARIVYKNNAGNTGHPVFGLASGGTDQIRCRLRISDSSGTDFSASTISLNTWTFVACTYDGSNVRVYKNGAEVDFVAETGTLAATNDVVVIGQNETGTSVDRHWPGLIDEVRVYNRALSASEILELYRVGARRVKIRQ